MVFDRSCELVLHVPVFPIMTTAPYICLLASRARNTIPEKHPPSKNWWETPIFTEASSFGKC
ncbi:hypothetical protein I3842_10G159400 [Carya illinoinensis]|uniref:Uncharacterized protein n=1 Tax=Carya illinoinensis TaxID=32201 RepID=A0A922E0R4_CARIL|nr:hypothetical protein I3842_10G159400 [Carya illinoinensis]KAG6693243.1 hypothetical protein I3842_10G159400 [Carya illinoinensis]